MERINIFEPKNETQTSFEYLKSNLEESFLVITDSVLKEFFKDIASEEKESIDYKLLSRRIWTPSRKTFSFLQKHVNLFKFWIAVLHNKSVNNVKLLQMKFFEDLMNGFKIYKKI